MAGKYFLVRSLLENWENNYGKTAVFPGSYSRIGEISHLWLRPDWGLLG